MKKTKLLICFSALLVAEAHSVEYFAANWSQLKTVAQNTDATSIVLTSDITASTSGKARVSQTTKLVFNGHYINFTNPNARLVVDGCIDAAYNEYIFRNASPLPSGTGIWNSAGGNSQGTGAQPTVFGRMSQPRHPGWWGLLHGEDASDCIQMSVDSWTNDFVVEGPDYRIVIGGKVILPAGTFHLSKPIDMTYRRSIAIVGQGNWLTELVADTGSSNSSPANVSFQGSAMFLNLAPNPSTWSFATSYRRFTTRTKGETPLSTWHFQVAGEGTLIEEMQGTSNGDTIVVTGNAIGLSVKDNHYVASSATSGVDKSFLTVEAKQGRIYLESNTYLGAGATAAVTSIRGAQIIINRMHIESCYNGVIIGGEDSSGGGRFNHSGQLTVNGLDMNGFPEIIGGETDVLRQQSAFIAVRNFDSTQVVATMLRSLQSFTTPTGRPLGEGDYWLMNAGGVTGANDNVEIPFVGTPTGQNTFGFLAHNPFPRNTPVGQ